MDERVIRFADRHAGGSELHMGELVQAIRSNEISLLSFSDSASSSGLADIYKLKASMADENGRSGIAAEFRSIAQQCEANAGNPCSLWTFSGLHYSYAVFELIPSNKIAGCLRFEGPLSSF